MYRIRTKTLQADTQRSCEGCGVSGCSDPYDVIVSLAAPEEVRDLVEAAGCRKVPRGWTAWTIPARRLGQERRTAYYCPACSPKPR